MKNRPAAVVFTDLDGTFLDQDSYDFAPALPAYGRCLERGVPVVFCSSKTRAEMEALRRAVASTDPFVVENGGAAFIPDEHFPFSLRFDDSRDEYGVLEFGTPYEKLVACFDEIRRRTGCRAEGFHDWDAAQVSRESGLSPEEAELARRREYDEPFLFREEGGGHAPPERLLEEIETAGLQWTRGGRFYHLMAHSGKREAVDALKRLYREWRPEVVTIGVGDSANDVEMLRAVDRAVLIRKPDGSYDARVLDRAPSVRKAPLPGPRGWNVMVGELLDELAPVGRGIGGK